MKFNKQFRFLILPIIGISFIYFSCITNEESSNEKIEIEIVSADLTTTIDEYSIDISEKTTISVEEESDTAKFFVYIRRSGFFTELKKCTNGEEIIFRSKPVYTDRICGVVFTDLPENNGLLASDNFYIGKTDSFMICSLTDTLGIYGLFLTQVSGNYSIEYQNWDSFPDIKVFEQSVKFNSKYQDIFLKLK